MEYNNLQFFLCNCQRKLTLSYGGIRTKIVRVRTNQGSRQLGFAELIIRIKIYSLEMLNHLPNPMVCIVSKDNRTIYKRTCLFCVGENARLADVFARGRRILLVFGVRSLGFRRDLLILRMKSPEVRGNLLVVEKGACDYSIQDLGYAIPLASLLDFRGLPYRITCLTHATFCFVSKIKLACTRRLRTAIPIQLANTALIIPTAING